MVRKLIFLLIVMAVLRGLYMNPAPKATNDLFYTVSPADANDWTIYRYSPITGKSVEIMKTQEYPEAGWSPDGRYLSVVGSYGVLTLIDTLDNSQRILTRSVPQGGCMTRISWSPDSRRMAYPSIESGGVVANILTLSDKSLITLPHSDNHGLSAKAWSANSRYFAYASRYTQQSVTIYDLEARKDVLSFDADWPSQVRWLGPSNQITYADGRGSGISVTDVSQGTIQQNYTGAYIGSVSPDGRYILGGDPLEWTIEAISLIDTQNQTQQNISGTHYATDGTWSYDSSYVLIANPSISAYRMADGTQQRLNDESGSLAEVSWSPSGHVVALAYWDKPFEDVYGFIEIHDLDTQELSWVSLPPSFEGGRALNWSPDGAYLAAQADDWADNPFGGVFLYERATQHITQLSDVYSGAYWSRDSRYLAIFEVGDDVLRVLDVPSMSEIVVAESGTGFIHVIGWQGSSEKNNGFDSNC